MATIVIDAGHGGYDAGAVNGTRFEKNDNLRMAMAVGERLERCGINVIYTRTTDEFVSLLQRSRISNNNDTDLFVSFHRNSATNPAANGVEILVYNNASAKSIQVAEDVLQSLVNVGIQSNRGVKRTNLSVLRETNAPAILIELGFINNNEDNELFDSRFDEYADAIARSLAQSVGVNCSPGNGNGNNGTPSNTTIRTIQSILNARYGAGLAEDGVWGPLSQKALIRALQIELNMNYGAGLITDGIFGPRTKAAIRNLSQGSRGNLVWILQAGLFVKGFETVLDSVFGPNTTAQVRAFQSANGLATDGIAGPNTFEALMR
ncbi:MAG: N-acetylmuramoyl-L-alanine amidase [Clostridia bacterium]|nr:N-acetylmuramoyl-L-alanine amidase [Clostridia bacterium]